MPTHAQAQNLYDMIVSTAGYPANQTCERGPMMTAATTYAALVDAANAQRLRLYGEEAPEARWDCEVAAPLGACTRRSRSPGAADRTWRLLTITTGLETVFYTDVFASTTVAYVL